MTHAADDLVLVRDGAPVAVIVVAADAPPQTASEPAMVLRYHVRRQTGADLPVLREGTDEIPAGVPTIYVGHTQQAVAQGIDISGMDGDGGVVKRIGNALFIVGRDDAKAQTFMEPQHQEPRVRRLYGTYRAVVYFMTETLGYRFFYPGFGGAYFPPATSIVVGELSLTTPTPGIRFGQGGGLTGGGFEPYRINLGGMNHDLLEYFGGHSFYAWVPTETYFAKHPDWYIEEKGVRTGKGNHICPTSPELLKHVVTCMEKVTDNGFKLIEFNYADSWNACDCKRCTDAISTHGLPDGIEGPEELMKRFTRDACIALQKTRPDARVMVLAYGPTRRPPTSFDRYPTNVVLQIADSDPRGADKWTGVADAFTAYTYNWTFADRRALSGQSSLFTQAADSRLFVEKGYQFIYFCGSPANLPIEGVSAYVTGRVLQDPSLEPDDLLRELCDKSYGPAGHAMYAFYSLAHRRIEIGDRVFMQSGTDLDQYLPYLVQWPIAELDQMQLYLDRARGQVADPKARVLLEWVQDGFSYLDVTSRLVHVYGGYLADPTPAKLAEIETMVKRRAGIIHGIFERKKHYSEAGLHHVFKGGITEEQVLMGGEGTNSQLRSPLTWDFAELKTSGFLPGKSRRDIVAIRTATAPMIDGKIDAMWAKAEVGQIQFVSGGRPGVPASIRVAYDVDRLYVLIDADEPLIDKLETQTYGRDGRIYGNECSEVLLDPQGLGLTCYHVIVGPQDGGIMDERVFTGGTGGSDRDWNADITWAYHRDSDAKAWRIELAIPFADLATTMPEAGEFWLANFTRTTRHQAFGMVQNTMPERFDRKHNSWNPILGTTKYADPKGMGKLYFGHRPDDAKDQP